MKSLFFPTGMAPVAAVAMFLMAVGCSKMTKPDTRIMEVNENASTITAMKGVERVTYDVAPEANITLDNKPAELKQLSAGDHVDVELEQRGGLSIAMRIDATSQKRISLEGETTPSPVPVY